MKKRIFLATLLFATAGLSVKAQSLKELLYSGKLKSDTGSVVRKTDDLSSKIDTSTRKPVAAPTSTVQSTLTVDSSGKTVVVETAVPAMMFDSTGAVVPVSSMPRDNEEVMKEYVDQLTADIRREALTNKKVKEGTYSVLLVYEIDVDGDINVNTISVSPSNDFLADQVKKRMILTAPKLTPLLNQYGKPRKAVKRQTIILTKG